MRQPVSANLIPVTANLAPSGADADGKPERDPFAKAQERISKARGKAWLLRTQNDGDGRSGAPAKDWEPNHLGPAPTAAQVTLAKDSFERTLAATGTPPSLYTDADGTSQREAVRQWHMGTVLPIANALAWELSQKLETPAKLHFDDYPRDMVSRA